MHGLSTRTTRPMLKLTAAKVYSSPLPHALLTCPFELRIGQTKTFPDKNCEGSRRGGGRATRRLGAAVAVSDRTSHLPLRTSRQPNENLPRKKMPGLTQGGWPSHQTIGSRSCTLRSHFSPATSNVASAFGGTIAKPSGLGVAFFSGEVFVWLMRRSKWQVRSAI